MPDMRNGLAWTDYEGIMWTAVLVALQGPLSLQADFFQRLGVPEATCWGLNYVTVYMPPLKCQ